MTDLRRDRYKTMVQSGKAKLEDFCEIPSTAARVDTMRVSRMAGASRRLTVTL